MLIQDSLSWGGGIFATPCNYGICGNYVLFFCCDIGLNSNLLVFHPIELKFGSVGNFYTAFTPIPQQRHWPFLCYRRIIRLDELREPHLLSVFSLV